MCCQTVLLWHKFESNGISCEWVLLWGNFESEDILLLSQDFTLRGFLRAVEYFVFFYFESTWREKDTPLELWCLESGTCLFDVSSYRPPPKIYLAQRSEILQGLNVSEVLAHWPSRSNKTLMVPQGDIAAAWHYALCLFSQPKHTHTHIYIYILFTNLFKSPTSPYFKIVCFGWMGRMWKYQGQLFANPCHGEWYISKTKTFWWPKAKIACYVAWRTAELQERSMQLVIVNVCMGTF